MSKCMRKSAIVYLVSEGALLNCIERGQSLVALTFWGRLILRRQSQASRRLDLWTLHVLLSESLLQHVFVEWQDAKSCIPQACSIYR